MGTIENIATAQTHALAAEHTIGRSRICALCIPSPQVSGEHAVIRWARNGWELRDLGSSNGTFINGQRLAVGTPVPLYRGARIVFGDRNNAFQLVDASPPPATARADDVEICSDEDGLLVLPDAVHPELVIAQAGDGAWIVTYEDGRSHRVHDQGVIESGGRTWALSLPEGMAPTLPAAGHSRSLAHVGLRFTVSRDEEDVQIDLIFDHPGGNAIANADRTSRDNPGTDWDADANPHWGNHCERLKPRAHSYTLLTLARARIADQANPALSPAEHGWVEMPELARQLKLSLAKLRLDIHRAKKQLEQAGVIDAAGLIERQPVSRKIRIGIAGIEVRRAGDVGCGSRSQTPVT